MVKIDKTSNKYTPIVTLKILAGGVLLTGLLTLVGVLTTQLQAFRSGGLYAFDNNITIIVGLTFIYLATLLGRAKRTAWFIALPLYVYIVAHNITSYSLTGYNEEFGLLPIILDTGVPLLVLIGLLQYRHLYIVRSEINSVSIAIKRVALFLLIALLYGTIGFQLLEKRDFHHEISLLTGMHYTIDQFGLTTDDQIVAHTRRANVFLESLTVISAGSFFYVLFSLFTPIKARISDQSLARERLKDLIDAYPSSSEDFFKLWPHDKLYFYDTSSHAGIAYKVVAGVALVVGDPVGEKRFYGRIVEEFNNYCHINDWLPAFIHTELSLSKIYKVNGYNMQKIGEEAIISTKEFLENESNNKYFRHIKNKFIKQGFNTELLKPPHDDAILRRLREISDDWLQVPGRDERGFMMGYFTNDYIQQGPVMVVRDSAGTMQAFLNQIMVENNKEANYDFLRYTRGSLGNINDYLMLNFIEYLQNEGFTKLNMGLCPLSGLENKQDNETSVVNSVLQFAYANGDRFYSFNGLRRFKDKYAPNWESRYIAYQGGLRGFSRTTTSLMLAMRVKDAAHKK